MRRMRGMKYVSILMLGFVLAGCGHMGDELSQRKAEELVQNKYEKESGKEVRILKTRETRTSYWITWEFKNTYEGGTSKVSQNQQVETIEKYTD